MSHPSQGLYIGDSLVQDPTGKVRGEYVTLLDEEFYCIRHYDRMPPFFLSIVSSSDHWMFISSTGGLSAGRSSAESAVFPYYPDDRLAENQANTGPVAIFQVTRQGRTSLWEPFCTRSGSLYRLVRNLYKNKLGDKLVFEESNLDLGLTYRYAWRFSDRYGLVKTCWLINDLNDPCPVALLDGLQNILPAGITTGSQSTFSNLLNAYKRNELDPKTGLAAFSLSSTMSDMPEPSEALRATTAWQTGLDRPRILLSSEQMDEFRCGHVVKQEVDVRGQRGAYLANKSLRLLPREQKQWSIVMEVNQDGVRLVSLNKSLREASGLHASLETDIRGGSAALEAIVASADGLQLTGEPLVSAHHFSNVLFNTMRGGIFARNYQISRSDFVDFMATRHKTILAQQADFFEALPEELDNRTLLERAASTGSANLERLCYEYLPLTFGRRHGDPSRPWNQFSINLKNPNGSQRLDYQGNWRDIFQNWEPLAWSYPEFVEQMVCKFLNATTVDGYNPYRLTRAGIEWEIPAFNDPWANIGYWGDHQIIYLEKLMEISSRFHPGALQSLLNRRVFSSANVPYRIKAYDSLLDDWYNTILFDRDVDAKTREAVKEIGTDGKLVRSAQGEILHVDLAEKLLVLLLVKLGNFIPEGGIWMNTQRPEWNDGNNALVGKGLSVVTLAYLRRYVVFFRGLLETAEGAYLSVSDEVKKLFSEMRRIFSAHQGSLGGAFRDEDRRSMMDELGQASSTYRWNYYENGLSGEFSNIKKQDLSIFLELVQKYIDHSLSANVRADHLYHAYNVLHLGPERASVSHLYEMLEGQVAVLSSGVLTGAQALALLQSLRHSQMYRPDQHSYTLYPNRDLPGFFQKNRLTAAQVEGSLLIAGLVEQGDISLIIKDVDGGYHFNGGFHNARDVKHALAALKEREAFAELVEEEADEILELFESAFDHRSFTGRSGTFFAYEGLGSIYWHMVTKLLLAVEELVFRAREQGEPRNVVHGLADAYHDIRKGLGFNKSPATYGAFPTDPYSHTPAGEGAKQPGMTGQVKEEILARWGELGVSVQDGAITFEPFLLDKREFLRSAAEFDYVDVNGQHQKLSVPKGSLGFTFCQIPIIYRPGQKAEIEIQFTDGSSESVSGGVLGSGQSRHVFCRDDRIARITVVCPL